MKARQVAEVVKWVKTGNRPEDYSPQKVSEYLKSLKPVTSPSIEKGRVESPSEAEPNTQPAPNVEPNPAPTHTPTQGHGTTAPEPKKDPGASGPNPQGEGHGLIVPGSKKDPGEVSVFWGTLAGIPWIKTIRAKIKAGQDPTLWEKLFLAAAFLVRCLVWVWKKTWPLVKKVLGWVLRFLKESVNGVLRFVGKVVGKPVEQVLQILVFLGIFAGVVMFFLHPAGWGAWTKNLVGRAWHSALTFAAGERKPVTPAPASGPKSQTVGRDLSVPIPEKGMGIPVPTVLPQPTAIPPSIPTPVPPSSKPRVKKLSGSVKRVLTQNSELKTLLLLPLLLHLPQCRRHPRQ